jgi:ribonucleotide reductase beta subunit family protein with ferritin-like domain
MGVNPNATDPEVAELLSQQAFVENVVNQSFVHSF